MEIVRTPLHMQGLSYVTWKTKDSPAPPAPRSRSRVDQQGVHTTVSGEKVQVKQIASCTPIFSASPQNTLEWFHNVLLIEKST